MTYKEAFLQCDSIEEIMEMANTDMAFAAVINSDRIPVIGALITVWGLMRITRICQN